MPTFEKASDTVHQMARAIIEEFPTHQPLIDAKVKVDLVFALSDKDPDTGMPLNDALKHNGVKALGIARKIGLKDRVLGRGDAEIAIDGDWWLGASDQERRALLDHEFHHLVVKTDKRGICLDDLGRPIIKLRPHDYQFGWFNIIAHRHGAASQEVQQASKMMADSGQYFWPEIVKAKSTQRK